MKDVKEWNLWKCHRKIRLSVLSMSDIIIVTKESLVAKKRGIYVEHTKADIIFKDFWRNNERFADLFNVVVFGGKEVIKPEALHEMDTDVSGVIQLKDYKETLSRTRDVIKKTAYGVEFVVLGIESQQHIHYAMPLRHMVYDAMSYLKEYQEITRKYKESPEKKTEDEFLSKMRKNDRLHPVITLTVYYGEKQWDGPYCLKDMIVEMPEEIAAIFSDYRMNLLEVRASDRYVFNNTDVQSVFEITREIFAGHFEKIQEKYGDKQMGSDLLTVVGQMTGSKELIRMSRNREVNSMCEALKKLKEEGEQKGREKEREAVILTMLQNNYPISEICKLLKISEEEVLEIRDRK